MKNFLRFLSIAILCPVMCAPGKPVGKPGQSGPVNGGFKSLAPLESRGSTDLHLVADDYTSGNWASRFGGYTATLTGAVTKQLTGQFPGRAELTGFTVSNAFKIAAAAAHTVQTNDTITYEWIVKTPTAFTASKAIGGYLSAGTTQIFNIGFYNSGTGNLESAVYNTAVAIYLGSTAGAAWNPTGKYNLFTLVMDIAAPRYEVYINGTSVFEDTSTTGTLSPTNTDFGIGARWSVAASAFQSPWDEGGTIVEVMRHREALADATVSARAAAFNAAKGY